MALKIADNLTLPRDAATQTFALLARRGAGKTHAASVIAEEMLEAGFSIVWLDPIGVAWGLRSKYSIAILGGEHADVPLEPGGGKAVADFLVSHRVPTILDVSTFGENEMRRFVADFAQRFYQQNREPVHLFIDEADEFAPQSVSGGPLAECLGAMQNIVRRGRARGIGVTLITQRSAVLNKSVLTQTECLIAMQTTAPHDLRAIDDWLKYHGTPEEREQIMHDLPKLQQGESWVYSPGWLKILRKVKFRARHSFDSSRTPKMGEHVKAPKSLAEVDLSRLTADMQATIERAKADDPRELRKQIADLQQKLRTAAATKATDPATLAAARVQAKNEALAAVKSWQQKKEQTFAKAKQFTRAIADALCEIDKALTPAFSMEAFDQLGKIWNAPENVEHRRQRGIHEFARPSTNGVQKDPADRLPIGEHKTLAACIQYPQGLRREQLTVLTGYKRSSRDAYIQRLREKQLVAVAGDRIVATEAGIVAMPNAEPLPRGVALRDFWINRLPQGERAILEQLLRAYPAPLRRDELDESTGYKRSSRDAYLNRLAAKELVREAGRGEVIASETLFE